MYRDRMRNKLGQGALQYLYVSNKHFGIIISSYLWHIIDSGK